MPFTGKLYHELFTDELSKRLQMRYPLNPLQDNTGTEILNSPFFLKTWSFVCYAVRHTNKHLLTR